MNHAQRVRRHRDAARQTNIDHLAKRRSFAEMVYSINPPYSGSRWTWQELVRARKVELVFGRRVTDDIRENDTTCGSCGRPWASAKFFRWTDDGQSRKWCSCGRIRVVGPPPSKGTEGGL